MESIEGLRAIDRRILEEAILSRERRVKGQSYALTIEWVTEWGTSTSRAPGDLGEPITLRFPVDQGGDPITLRSAVEDGTVIDEDLCPTSADHTAGRRFRIKVQIAEDSLGVLLEDTTIALDYEGTGEDDPWNPFEERWASWQLDRDAPDYIGRVIAWLGDNLDRLIEQNL